MTQVQITDFRAHLPKYLARVKHGETITVMSRSTPVAKLVPVGEAPVTAREHLVALRKKARIGDVVAPVGVSWNATHDPA